MTLLPAFARAFLVLCIGTAMSCGDVAGARSVEGRYTLRTLNGSSLPYDHEGLGCCWYLAGTLTLTASMYTADITAQNFAGTEPFTATDWGTYTVEGAVLTFVSDSFDLAPLLLSPASVTGDVIELGLGGEGPGAPDQFLARFVREP